MSFTGCECGFHDTVAKQSHMPVAGRWCRDHKVRLSNQPRQLFWMKFICSQYLSVEVMQMNNENWGCWLTKPRDPRTGHDSTFVGWQSRTVDSQALLLLVVQTLYKTEEPGPQLLEGPHMEKAVSRTHALLDFCPSIFTPNHLNCVTTDFPKHIPEIVGRKLQQT